MSYQIVLQLEEVAGALARVMSSLRKLGLTTMAHSFEALPGGGRKLTLEVEGPVLDDEQLRPQLESLRGVMGLLGGGAAVAQEAPAAAQSRAEAVDTRYKDKNSEAGDAEIRDRMLIFSLLSRYPNLSGRLIEIDSSIPEAERPQRMLELGQGFGRYLSKNLQVNGVVSELRTAIEFLIIPGLSPLAQISRSSEGLRITGFTRNMKLAAQRPECCRFITGTIQGLLDSADSLPAQRVEHIQCMHDGATSCEYRISPVCGPQPGAPSTRSRISIGR